jgi:hypothetical protein
MLQFGSLTLHKSPPVKNKRCIVKSKNDIYCVGIYAYSIQHPFPHIAVNLIYLKNCSFYKLANDTLVPFICDTPNVTSWHIQDEYWILQESYLAKMKQKLLRKILCHLVNEDFIVDAYLYKYI